MYSYFFFTFPQNWNENNCLTLILTFCNVLMLSSFFASCTWLPLKTCCYSPVPLSSLAEKRELFLGQERTNYPCALHIRTAET